MLKRRRLNHMNPIQKDICNLEKQILKDRELLMDLAGKSQTLSDALYKDKIYFMKCEIDYLQNQYRIIEKHYNERSNATVSDIAKSSIAASKPVVLMERESDDSFIPTEIVPLTVSKETPVDTLSSTEVNKEVKPFVELPVLWQILSPL